MIKRAVKDLPTDIIKIKINPITGQVCKLCSYITKLVIDRRATSELARERAFLVAASNSDDLAIIDIRRELNNQRADTADRARDRLRVH